MAKRKASLYSLTRVAESWPSLIELGLTKQKRGNCEKFENFQFFSGSAGPVVPQVPPVPRSAVPVLSLTPISVEHY